MAMLKDPADVLDFGVDWTKELSTYISDTIATSTWTAETGITINSQSNSPTVAVAWLSGGTAGTTYKVTNHIVTAGGRTYERSISVAVLDR